MDTPFKPALIETIHAGATASISTLKANPAAVIAEARHRQVAILSRNRPVAYIVSPEVWDYVSDLLDDARDAEVVRERLADPSERIAVAIDDLV